MGSMLPKRWLEPPVLQAVRQVKQIAAEAGVTLAQFALAWVLRKPEMSAAIIGASRPEQVAENAAAADLSIDAAYFLRAEQILEPVR
jgi:aryl-alcohol dehydrogenase-like predicted oxidoreductase